MNKKDTQFWETIINPIIIFGFLEIINGILGFSDIGLGAYYINSNSTHQIFGCSEEVSPIPELLIVIGILSVIGCCMILDNEVCNYKFTGFICIKLIIFGLSCAECAMVAIKHRQGCEHKLFNYVTGVSIYRILLYIVFSIVMGVIHIYDYKDRKHKDHIENTKDLAEEDIVRYQPGINTKNTAVTNATINMV